MAKDPGWYDDPSTADRYRWWDGTGWTSWVGTDRHAAPPARPGRRITPQPSAADRILRQLGILALVLLLGFAVLAGIGMYLNRRDMPAAVATTPTGPLVTTTPENPRARISDGVLNVSGYFSVKLPSQNAENAYAERNPLFDDQINVTVDDATIPATQVRVGTAAEGLFITGSEQLNSEVAAAEVARAILGEFKPTLGAPTSKQVTLDGRRAWSSTIPVTFTADGTTRKGEVTAVTVQVGATPTWMLWVQVTFDDSPAQSKDAITTSLASMRFER
ncbi:DUF2510 domain-containing protein [Propionibacteriaceae bacterium G1746]|uniref:DUF2510 domain-containing protein n=1 Tax=Aestuariimicrobium sp. G57 TaxID=3418485 RepID=UPI003C1F961E